jgi:hypothetical protein
MATVSVIFTTPVAQPQQTGVILGDPISINMSANNATIPYSQRTAAGAIAGTSTQLVVNNLTPADITAILDVLINRARANGAPLPAGAVTAA